MVLSRRTEESSHRSKHHLSGCRMDWHSHFGHPIADGKLTYGAIQLASVALVDKLLGMCQNMEALENS